MDTKVLIGLAVILGLVLVAFLSPQQPPRDSGELVGSGRFVLERGGETLLEEEYTVFFHPTEGYMLLSQGRLHVEGGPIMLAQQAQYDPGFVPVFYQLAAETPTGTQLVSAQMGPAGLAMEVRAKGSRQTETIPAVDDLALLDNNVLGQFSILLRAIRSEALDREFTAAVPQALLSVPARVDGPNTVEFSAGEATYQGKGFEVHLGDTRILLIEHEGRMIGLINRTQGTLGYDVARFPDGIEVTDEPAPSEPPAGILEKQLDFESGELTLAGTLALPKEEGPHPAALFIHGSGPVDRDGNAPGLPMDAYRQLAYGLAEAGIASLRFDKRGVGASEGDSTTASRADLVSDARSALTALRSREEIDPDRILLIGHSEGAYLAPVVAADDDRLAGVALLAGAARPLDEITRWQVETTLRQRGATDEQIAAALEQEDEYIAFVETSMGAWSDYSVEALQEALPWLTEEAASGLLATPLSLSWLREHYLDRPVETLRAVRAPVFILNGEKDSQVPSAEARRIATILRDSGNTNVTVHVLPDLNHLLRHHPGEPSLAFRHIADPVDPRVIERLSEWAVAHVDGG